MTEAEIIDSLKSGDHTSMRPLMEMHQNYVYTILFSMLKSSQDAEEASQDTFVKVYNKVGTYDNRSKFTTWLYSVAYRTGLDYLKKRKPTSALDEIDLNKKYVDRSNPESKLERSERSAIIGDTVDKLQPEDAAIVRMYYFKELNLKEISDISGLTISNVKIKLFRARKQLRKLMINEHITES